MKNKLKKLITLTLLTFVTVQAVSRANVNPTQPMPTAITDSDKDKTPIKC